MESLDDKWIFQGRVEECEDQEKTPNTLGLKNMAGVFILVAVGIVVGMFLIVIEIGYKKHHVRKQNRLQLARNYGQTWRAIVQVRCGRGGLAQRSYGLLLFQRIAGRFSRVFI